MIKRTEVVVKGVVYYLSEFIRYVCVEDIDVDPDVKTVYFKKYTFDLKNSEKVFPDVEELVIDEDVFSIEINNRMFPNVRKVVSHSNSYMSGPYLIRYNNILKNTFCLRPDEILDLRDIDNITMNALDGCKTVNIINYEKTKCQEHALDEYYSYMKDKLPQKGNLIMFGNIIVGVADESEVIIPEEAIDIYSSLCCKKVIVKNTSHHLQFLRKISCDYLFFDVSSTDDTEDLLDYLLNTCTSVKNIIVPENNPLIKTVDGIIYSKDGRYLIYCPRSKSGTVIIPEGTREIGTNAFHWCQAVKSVILPSSMEAVNNCAFKDTNIESVDLGGTKIVEEEAFGYCIKLKTVKADNVELLCKNAFFAAGIQEISLPNLKRAKENSLCGIPKIKLREIPPTIINAITNNNLSKVEYNISEVECNGLSFFFPRFLSYINQNKLEQHIKMFPIDQNLAYYISCLVSDPITRKCISMKSYKMYHIIEFEKYLRKTAWSFIKTLVNDKKEDLLIEFLELGLATRNTLQKTLDMVNKEELTSVSAYVLQALNNTDDSQKTFAL